jgi:beta-glucosidase
MKELKNTGKPLVVVNMSGSAVAMNWENSNAAAIVQAWYGGQAGGTAIMDVLFGDYNPAGRLPVTFYKSETDLPAFDDYSMKGRTYRYFTGEPLYAFGYGLSYTKFEYTGVSTNTDKVSTDGTIKLKVQVKNTGKYDGDEVVQVYFKQPKSVTDSPLQSLVAFQRISFKKGEQKELVFDIPVSQLRHFDSKKAKYDITKGKYDFMIGATSDDIRQRITVEVTEI